MRGRRRIHPAPEDGRIRPRTRLFRLSGEHLDKLGERKASAAAREQQDAAAPDNGTQQRFALRGICPITPDA
jgi:hypothetical protein